MKNSKKSMVVSFSIKIIFIFIIISAIASYNAAKQISNWQRETESIHVVVYQVEKLLRLSIDSETASRGYLLTGNYEFLSPMYDASKNFPFVLAQASNHLYAIGDLREPYRNYASAINDYVEARMNIVELFKSRAIVPGFDVLSSNKKAQDDIRKKYEGLTKALDEDLLRYSESIHLASRALKLSTMFFCLSIVVLIVVLRKAWASKIESAEELRKAELTFGYALDCAPVGVALVDSRLTVKKCNKGFDDISGRPSDGSTLLELFTENLSSVLVNKIKERRATFVHEIQGANGNALIRWTISPVVSQGFDCHHLILAEDITDENQAHNKITRYQRLLQNATRLSGVDGWAVSLKSRKLEIGSHTLEVLGLTETPSVRQVLRLILPASRKKLLSVMRESRDGIACFRLEITMLSKAGICFQFEIIGQYICSGESCNGLEGAIRDVTISNAQLRKSQKNEARLNAIAKVTNDILWEIDLDNNLLSHTQSIGISSFTGEIPLSKWVERIYPDDEDAVVASFKKALEGNESAWASEFRYNDKYGNVGVIESKAAILRDANGRAIHVVGGAQDLSKRRKMQAAMMNMAASAGEQKDEQIFEVLLRNLVQGLDADGGCIARISNANNNLAETLAVLVDGKCIEDFNYAIRGTPCENLLTEGECYVPDDLAQRFPRANGISGLSARSYIGGQLIDEQGKIIGFIYVLYRAPIVRTDFMSSVIQVFAVRAAAEIQRIEAKQLLREQAELLDHAKEAIIVLDLDLKVKFWNKGAEQMYGVAKGQAIGLPVAHFYSDASVLHDVLPIVLKHEQYSAEFSQITQPDKSTITVDESWTLISDSKGLPKSILKVGIDVTERNEAENKIAKLAHYDTLTGLPNRRLFMEKLKQAVSANGHSGSYAALLFIDLDNFKNVNDLHGHLRGDQLLVAVASTLARTVRKNDTVARLGGDEFVVILNDLDLTHAEAMRKASQVAAGIVNALEVPITFEGLTVYASASVGVALFSKVQEDELDELLRQADVAMYEAKDYGRNGFRVFSASNEQSSTEKASLAQDLKGALDNKEFELWYQKQYDEHGRPYGVEALLRWRHPIRGLVSPGDFIPLAEKSSLIVAIGRWVLEAACAQLSDWVDECDFCHIKMSVNVSMQQLKQDSFVEDVLSCIARHKVDPGKICLEVTEGVLDEKNNNISMKLHSLRQSGVMISLDDFGTGYSSLSRLKNMPFDEIKIDKSFIDELPHNLDDAAIAIAILTLGKSLRMHVVAEGVENFEQLEFLKRNGCVKFQGYYYSRPAPAAILIE
ncbi:EAL domain-containing protein [Pseudomonas putida]|uniref:EAL domain-containing protein n=2 Tax=Pseudomonas TaxID=286 RepID=UPI0034662E81